MLIQGDYIAGSLVFPGSFNPLHDGHVGMATVASARYGVAVQPELSIANVDKPDVDSASLSRRLAQVQVLGSPLVTRAALFADKATLFPGCRFVVGADTALRLSDPSYAGGDPRQLDRMLAKVAVMDCRFVVFGRLVEGKFRDAEALPLCERLKSLCDFVGEAEFRVDVRSQDLR